MIALRIVLLVSVAWSAAGLAIAQEGSSRDEQLNSLKNSIELLDKLIEKTGSATDVDQPQQDINPPAAVSDLSKLLQSLGPQSNEALGGSAGSQRDPTNPDDIRQKLEILRRLRKNRRADRMEEISPAKNPLRNPQQMQGSGTKALPPGMQDNDMMAGSGTKSIMDDEQLPSRPAANPMSGDRVIPGPVDAFAMGNSLFMTGQFEAALKAYQAVDQKKQSAFDVAWLRYMMATCHRKLGNIEQANRYYRATAKEKNVAILVNQANQWLELLDHTRASNETYNSLATEFDALMERMESQ